MSNTLIKMKITYVSFCVRKNFFSVICERNFNINNVLFKIVPSNIKSSSSNEWLTRQLNDYYVRKSRYDHYRCRSAYKLLEMDEKYNILKPGYSVVDCGAAPGSWTQVVIQKLKLNDKVKSNSTKPGIAIAIDLQYIMPIKGATIVQESDFTNLLVQERVYQLLPDGKADVVLSDMAPNATGTTDIDSVAILKLVYSALSFSVKTLKKGGTFVCKVWDSAEIVELYKHLSILFESVKRVKPKASRSDSSELFLLARGYKNIEINK